MATVRDIAALIGVSTATVSRVLNESEMVAPETVAKVNEAIKELNYKKRYQKEKELIYLELLYQIYRIHFFQNY